MNKGRISRRGALLVSAFMVFATPAFASLVVQNYMEADVTVTDACFVKVAGDDITSYTAGDADDPDATFDGVSNTIEVDGTDLLEERLTIRGMRGDRVTYTDVVRYQNQCNVPLDVTLIASGTPTGDWVDRSARIYLSETSRVFNPAPGGPEPDFATLGLPGTSTGWNPTPIIVEEGGTIGGTGQTGTVTLAVNEEIYGAISVAAGVAAAPDSSTVNWVAQAVNAN